MDNSMAEGTNVPVILDGTFFEIVSSDKIGKEVKVKARCVTCQTEKRKRNGEEAGVIKGSLTVTSNFITHLKRTHQKAFQEYETYSTDPNTNAKRKRQSTIPFEVVKRVSTVKSKLERVIFDYIINSMLPLNTVDDEYFINLCHGLNEEADVMCQQTLRSRIRGEFARIQGNLKAKLDDVKYICSTADIWSSRSRSFIGVTVHWINTDFQRESSVLTLKRFQGSHTGKKIAEILSDLYKDFGIQKKLVSVVTDNGSNFVKAMKIYGYEFTIDEGDSDDSVELQFGYEIEDDDYPVPDHLRCASHTLSLVATDDLEKEWKINLDSQLIANCKKFKRLTFAKCSALWNKVGRSVQTAEKLKEILGNAIKRPGDTRWNATFDSVTQLSENRCKLDEIMTAAGLPKFSQTEKAFLGEYSSALKPIATAIDTLQSEKDFYYGYYAPIIVNMISKLEQKISVPTENGFGAVLSAQLREAVKDRFKDIAEFNVDKIKSEILAACTMPCFKLRWIPDKHRSVCKTLFQQEARRYWNEMSKVKVAGTRIDSRNNKEDAVSKWDLMFGNEPHTPAIEEGLADIESTGYLCDSSTTLESLQNYTIIKSMFMRYNTSLPSSAPVERLFSYSGMILSPKRSNLSDDLFEQLVLLKLNSTPVIKKAKKVINKLL